MHSQIGNEMQKVKNKYRGVEQLVARQAHNLEVACSSRVSATILKRCKALFLTPLLLCIRFVSNAKIRIRKFMVNFISCSLAGLRMCGALVSFRMWLRCMSHVAILPVVCNELTSHL